MSIEKSNDYRDNILAYKGYYGSVEYSEEDALYYGSLLDMCGLVEYDGATLEELEEDFRDAVTAYIEMINGPGIDKMEFIDESEIDWDNLDKY